ncbi:MAG: hypothetical protein FJ387_10080 [Verrucomicrobia bacterium]|nr:hypothetical protein [Verrucomicrobiota bacterium]
MVLGVVGMCGCGAGAVSAELELPRLSGATPRNVVFILADDHRYDALGFLGHPWLETPHLDALARGGVHCRNAFVTTALCSPSRASTLTGKNGLNVNGKRVPQKGYITDELTDYALAWLRARPAGQPFFLYLSHKAVHAEFVPAERHRGRYRDRPWRAPANQADTAANYGDKPMWLKNQRNSWHGVDFPYHSDLNIEHYYKAYCETLLALDDSVGRVVGFLRSAGPGPTRAGRSRRARRSHSAPGSLAESRSGWR